MPADNHPINPRFSALTETLDDIRAALAAGQVLVARVGSGREIGHALLAAVEARFTARRFVLHTGDRSVANLRLYERAGYVRSRVEPIADALSLVHLEKASR